MSSNSKNNSSFIYNRDDSTPFVYNKVSASILSRDNLQRKNSKYIIGTMTGQGRIETMHSMEESEENMHV